MIFPENALFVGAVGRLGCWKSVAVDAGEGKIPVHQPHLLWICCQQALIDLGMPLAAVWAFVIAKFYNRNRRVSEPNAGIIVHRNVITIDFLDFPLRRGLR